MGMTLYALLPALLPIAVVAQTTFAPIGAMWTYEQGSWSGPDTTLMAVEVVSDTIMSGRLFSKVQVNEGWTGCHEFVQYYSDSNDSLFYYEHDSGLTQLLFRWNASIGETWSTPIEQTGYLDTLDWTVLDTSHVLVDGLWLRSLDVSVESRQWLFFSYGGTITERLGGSWAPFTWILGFCDGETFLGLRCYEDADITWQNPQVLQCDLGVGIKEHDEVNMVIDPTLAVQGQPIQVSTSVGTLEVFDATGRVVRELSSTGNLTFDLHSPGAYLVRLSGRRGEVAIGRILVR